MVSPFFYVVLREFDVSRPGCHLVAEHLTRRYIECNGRRLFAASPHPRLLRLPRLRGIIRPPLAGDPGLWAGASPRRIPGLWGHPCVSLAGPLSASSCFPYETTLRWTSSQDLASTKTRHRNEGDVVHASLFIDKGGDNKAMRAHPRTLHVRETNTFSGVSASPNRFMVFVQAFGAAVEPTVS
ncbi:hypothetical protein LZ32DRAFT_644690 [Colletotrichum eremochloae]|nr:hypothetical protein LZ32DRAFT_644690 [Colletotrichum eremochloae]